MREICRNVVIVISAAGAVVCLAHAYFFFSALLVGAALLVLIAPFGKAMGHEEILGLVTALRLRRSSRGAPAPLRSFAGSAMIAVCPAADRSERWRRFKLVWRDDLEDSLWRSAQALIRHQRHRTSSDAKRAL